MKMALFLDNDSIVSHHGVRRLLLCVYNMLRQQGHEVDILFSKNGGDVFYKFTPDATLLANNFFSGNRKVASSREEILIKLSAGELSNLYEKPDFSGVMADATKLPSDTSYDMVVVAAPWAYSPKGVLPKGESYKCVAYDVVPISYYFDRPEDLGLRVFANQHNEGFIWADKEQDGLIAISKATQEALLRYGYGHENGVDILPPIIPPGFDCITEDEISHKRGNVAILTAPFDPRKGMADIPAIVNNAPLDELIIVGRPRCSMDDLKAFFEDINIENISWYADVDFKMQKELYLQAKVLLFPSLNEGLGLPILEAYASGLRVLLRDELETSYLALPEDRMHGLDEFHQALVQTLQEETNPITYWNCSQSMIEKMSEWKIK